MNKLEKAPALNYDELNTHPILVPYETAIHDLKMPMSIIFSTIQNIEEEKDLNKKLLKHIDVLKKNWFRAIKIITDLNDFKRIFSGGMNPKLRNYNMVELLREITKSANNLASRKNIKFVFKSYVKEIKIATDKDMLERILLNLFSNSIKYSEVGDIINVSFICKDDYYIIKIKDTSLGIGKDDLYKVFENHYTENNKSSIHGAGIGLYIVRELIMLLGGNISINNNEQETLATEIELKFQKVQLKENPVELKFLDDFYSDNIVQIELSDDYL